MRLLTNVSLYASANIIAKLFIVLSIPILARNLTVEEYGSYTILLSLFMLFSSFFLLGSDQTLNFYFHKFKNVIVKGIKVRELVISTQFFFIMGVLLTSLPFIYVIIGEEVNYRLELLLWLFFSVIYLYFLNVLRVSFDVKIFSLLEIFRSIIYFLAVYLLVNTYQYGLIGAVKSSLFSYSLAAIIVACICVKQVKVCFSFALLCRLLSFGAPFIFSSLVLWASTQSDRYFLMYFLDSYVLGIYGFSLSFASVFILLKGSIKNAVDPYIMKMHHGKNVNLTMTISKLFTLSLFFFCLIFLVVTFFLKDITFMVGAGKFKESVEFTPYVILIVLITTMNQYFIYGINFKYKNNLILKYLVYSLTINLLLSTVLVINFNVAGVIFANIVSSAIYSYLLYSKSNNLYPIKYFAFDNYKIVLSTLALFALDLEYLSPVGYIGHFLVILLFIVINLNIIPKIRSIYSLN